ncbi:HlyC/CorC family transporter [Antarcticirhabdus aurantiaca]|uniref:HlyC/CorC family transporter n=1 Tax=Antarcticirhabdus aurantiaca TaxID=2606717 RepID=UPI00131B9AC1
MTLELWLVAGAVLVLLLFAAVLSAAESAMSTASKARLAAADLAGERRAARAARLLDDRDRIIGALLLANNLACGLAVVLAAQGGYELYGVPGLAGAGLLATLAIVVFCEVLPRSLALARPDRAAERLSGFARAVALLFGPAADAVDWFVRGLLRVFGQRREAEALLTARDELRGAMEVLHREGALVEADAKQLGGLLDLHELEVSDVMVHRTAMRQLNADEAPAEIVRQVLDSPHSRMPLWRGEPDNIVGVVHAKDLLRALHEAGDDPSRVDVRAIASRPWFVPETTTLQDQLNAFLRRRTPLALVVDEYGEVEGLITLEDILEEIVGNIADEHDLDIQGVTQEADGSVIVDGSVPIRDLNRALGWSLPDEEAVTIAGLVIHETQSIPEERQAFTFFAKRFTVLKRERNRIARLRIRDASVVVPPKKTAAAVVQDEMREPAPQDLYESFDEGWHEAGEADVTPAGVPLADAEPERGDMILETQPDENGRR